MLSSVTDFFLSIADSIIATILGSILWIIMLWTFTIASFFEDENGEHLHCETSDTKIELCERREWNLVI
jgi:hypothetical protein